MKSKAIFLSVVSIFLLIGLAACSSASKQEEMEMPMREQAAKNGCGMGMMNHSKMGMMTPEMHEQMAEKHKSIAECLKSGKSQKDCMSIMDKDSMCMMGGKGMMKQGAMMNESMMKNMDQCMAQMKGKTMNKNGMGMMKQCMTSQMAKQGSTEMSGEQNETRQK